ncbi:MAG: ATP-binding protein, partial [Pseudomonadota bacterium]
ELAIKFFANSKMGSDLVYLCVDSGLRVLEVSDNWSSMFPSLPSKGDVLDDVLEFTTGMQFGDTLELPIVETKHGRPFSVSTLNEPDRQYFLIRDASDRKARHQQLQQAANDNELLLKEKQTLLEVLEQNKTTLEHASRLQNAFLAGVAHEFRTPLVSILGFSELASKEITLATQSEPIESSSDQYQVLDWLSGIQRSSAHMLGLIENLLDHGQAENQQLDLNLSTVNIAELLNEVQSILIPQSAQKGLQLTVENKVPEKSSWLYLDGSRMRQCLINIAGNAIKFTEYGSVSMRADYLNGDLILQIDDTGTGMTQDELRMVAEPFWQSSAHSKPGTGLGTTISRRLIELMGGELQIDSTPGMGTKVRFTIPAFTSDAPQEDESVDTRNDKDLRMLLVEDDEDISTLLVALLEDEGISVTLAGDGANALALLAKSPEQFNLVLMDVYMPVLNGLDCAIEMRRHGFEHPIIMMSATPLVYQENNQPAPYDAYISKPIDLSELFNLTNQLVPSMPINN